jgi:hypothetical protein
MIKSMIDERKVLISKSMTDELNPCMVKAIQLKL